jgi:hypothetical protein
MEVNGMKPTELVRLQRRALIIMHASFSKMIGVIQHFGLFNSLYLALKMMRKELIAMLGASELVLYNIKNENKILKDLALISDN